MLIVFITTILLFIFGIIIFLKYALEKNSFKIIGVFMALVFGLASFYIYLKANTEGVHWVYLDKKVEIYNLQPFPNASYIKEDSHNYFIMLENSNTPLKILKDDTSITNSNDLYKNKVIKETIMKVSTKASNNYSFLAKEGEIKYEVFYHIYLDY